MGDCKIESGCPHVEDIANRAAKAAVKETFSQLGVDVDKPSEVEEFRCDLRVARNMRKTVQKGFTYGFCLVVGAILAVFLVGLKNIKL